MNPLAPLLIALAFALAVLLMGYGVIGIVNVRDEATALGHANWAHCHAVKGTPEYSRFGCQSIAWGELGQP